MSDIVSCVESVRPESSPGPRAQDFRFLEQFAVETREALIRLARESIRRDHLDPISLAPEGAVQAAWLVLWPSKVKAIVTREDFAPIFTVPLEHVRADENRRQRPVRFLDHLRGSG